MVIYWVRAHISEKGTEAFLHGRKRFILNINAVKMKYTFMSCQ
jgi:hypothetical protein